MSQPPITRAVAANWNSSILVVIIALLLSGAASIVNQVVWQRALKIFLGGSETFSSMIVVLVFMLGLGVGAIVMGMRSGGISHLMRAFGVVELSLAIVNVLIACLLSLDISQSVYAFERLAVSVGIPLRAIYAGVAMVVLLPPTVLMGATLPIASEACQRQFGAKQSRLIAVLFCVNTFGAVIGAFGCSFFLLPFWGQRVSLFLAAGANLIAAVSLLAFSLKVPPAAKQGVVPEEQKKPTDRRIRLEEVLGTGLGFFSLGYEMYLFRLMALAHQPLPSTFATTLCFFLLFWSAGVFAASRVEKPLWQVFLTCAGFVAAMPLVYFYDRWYGHFNMFGFRMIYFVPCLGFGYLYGKLVSRSAFQWGPDVGRFYGLNTLGSCLGIGMFTLIGYEIRHDFNAIVIAFGLIGLLASLMIGENPIAKTRNLLRVSQAVIALTIGGLVIYGLQSPHSDVGEMRAFWGCDGVVEVHETGDIYIDGFWHSKLSDGSSHVGSLYSWMMAFAAVFAHRDETISDALVVGNGVGITASTLAKLDGIHVDAYEINHTLQKVLQAYPTETLNVESNPHVDIIWRDARSGLALNLKQYDVIVSSPVHLRQAGSTILLSREYMQLVASRLKKNGVFAMYSYEGVPEQSLLIRRTVASVFQHVETFLGGVLTVASNSPIEITAESIASRLDRSDAFYVEAARYDRVIRQQGSQLYDSFDSKRLSYSPGKYLITDDHPLVEHPNIVKILVTPTTDEDESLSQIIH